MKDLINAHQEIASYLGDESSLHLLKELSSRHLNGEFYLPVIGQYSAGKSKFINTLLGMDYLPTKGTETTAIPTFIAYGEEEGAFIEHHNGSIWSIAPEALKSYRHTGDGMALEDIKALHLKLNNPLLEQGLIIVDTPGFNTLVRAHEDATLSIIPQAQFLIYVMGKSLTDYDVKFLRKIEGMGIELIFVRTKLDEIKTSEESLEDLLELENTKLQKYFERKRPFFAITSDGESLKQSQWQWRIEAIQEYIVRQINPRLQDLWNQSLGQRLLVLGRGFHSHLKEKQELLRSAGSVNVEMLQEQVAYLEQQIQIITKSHHTSSNQIQMELTPFLLRIKSDANQYKEACALKFARDISLQSNIDAMQKWTQNTSLEQVEAYIQHVQLMFTDYKQQMIEKGFKGAQSRIQEISEQLESTLNLKTPFKLNLPNTDRMNQQREYAVDQLQEELELIAELLQQNDDELKKYNLTSEKVQAMAQEMGRFVYEARSEVEGIEPYSPQMKFVEGNQNASETMGKIGNVADWLTLFIPGKNTATIATKVGKVAKVTQITQKLNVSAKTLQAATKTIETVAKGNELLRKVNKAKDIMVKAKDFQTLARQKFPKEQSGLLDLITLEYWFSKAGTLFDTPPHYELDKVAEAGYLNRKRELEQRHVQAIQKEINQLDELQLLRKKEERVKKEKEIQLRNQKSLEKQLEVERERAGKEAAATYAQQLASLFEEELSRVHAMLLLEIEQAYRHQVQAIIISATVESKQRMESMQNDLQRLLEEKHHQTTDQDQAVQQVDVFLEYLVATAARLEGNEVCIH